MILSTIYYKLPHPFWFQVFSGVIILPFTVAWWYYVRADAVFYLLIITTVLMAQCAFVGDMNPLEERRPVSRWLQKIPFDYYRLLLYVMAAWLAGAVFMGNWHDFPMSHTMENNSLIAYMTALNLIALRGSYAD